MAEREFLPLRWWVGVVTVGYWLAIGMIEILKHRFTWWHQGWLFDWVLWHAQHVSPLPH